jgi:hypothetical protein
MTPSRTTIMTALFTLLQGVTSFAFTSQRFVMWDQLSPQTQFPALLLWEEGDHYEWLSEPTARVTMTAQAIMYLNASADQTVAPVQDIDALLDLIDAALKPTGPDKLTGRQSLGGLVYNCRIEGEVKKASGDLDNISVLIVPIHIVVGMRTV